VKFFARPGCSYAQVQHLQTFLGCSYGPQFIVANTLYQKYAPAASMILHRDFSFSFCTCGFPAANNELRVRLIILTRQPAEDLTPIATRQKNG
jgi:hypothetical protein